MERDDVGSKFGNEPRQGLGKGEVNRFHNRRQLDFQVPIPGMVLVGTGPPAIARILQRGAYVHCAIGCTWMGQGPEWNGQHARFTPVQPL